MIKINQRIAKTLVRVALALWPELKTRLRIGHDTIVDIIDLDELFAEDDERKREASRRQLELPLENLLKR